MLAVAATNDDDNDNDNGGCIACLFALPSLPAIAFVRCFCLAIIGEWQMYVHVAQMLVRFQLQMYSFSFSCDKISCVTYRQFELRLVYQILSIYLTNV